MTRIARACSDFPRQLLGMAQLDGAQVAQVLDRAQRFAAGDVPRQRSFSAALLFLQPSLRTCLGFAEAVRRLGGVGHMLPGLRESDAASAPESLADTLRVAGGMTAVQIVRTGERLSGAAAGLAGRLVNAGDALDHPTQALIDLFAFEQLRGPVDRLAIGLCGDMGMRSARSLLQVFSVRPPRLLRIMAPAGRLADARDLAAAIPCPVSFMQERAWDGLDVLHMVGLPERAGGSAIAAEDRARFAVTAQTIGELPDHAGIFSPMPIIDEIAVDLRGQDRILAYRQSDLGIYVRMAVLDLMLDDC